MLKLSTEQKAQFAAAVKHATGSPMLSLIEGIYVDFEAERSVRKPLCSQSGECCRFERHGHRLFVTVMEMARFVQGVAPRLANAGDFWDGTGCPFQVGGLCDVHPSRPFGCRAYFCDPSSTEWQNDQYERLHREIRELHDLAGVPYLYVEWREALDAVGVSPSSRSSTGRALPVVR
jgi:Fe-S-cluster containining protein